MLENGRPRRSSFKVEVVSRLCLTCPCTVILISPLAQTTEFPNIIRSQHSPPCNCECSQTCRVDNHRLMSRQLPSRGVPSRLLYFPEENHWVRLVLFVLLNPALLIVTPSYQVLNPQNSMRWHHEVFRWLDEWVGDSSLMRDSVAGQASSSSVGGLQIQAV